MTSADQSALFPRLLLKQPHRPPGGDGSPLARKIAVSRFRQSLQSEALQSTEPAPAPVAGIGSTPPAGQPSGRQALPSHPQQHSRPRGRQHDEQPPQSQEEQQQRQQQQRQQSPRSRRRLVVSSLQPALSPIDGGRDAAAQRARDSSVSVLDLRRRGGRPRSKLSMAVTTSVDGFPVPALTPLSRDVLRVVERVTVSDRNLGGGEWPPKVLPYLPGGDGAVAAAPWQHSGAFSGVTTRDDADVIRAMTPIDTMYLHTVALKRHVSPPRRGFRG